MNRLSRIKEEILSLMESNNDNLSASSNDLEKDYYNEYGRILSLVTENFMKAISNGDEERNISKFYLADDSLSKKLAERKKLVLSGGINNQMKRAEINANVDFLLSIENILSNGI